MNKLQGTKTAGNLMKAFAGESQARNRYTYYASVANNEGYKQIRDVFQETADHEKEHAKRFYKFLLAGLEELPASIMVEAEYPVAQGTTLDNLKAAAMGEKEEWDELYPMFADIADEEGFPEIAEAFRSISISEKYHEDRFNKLAANIEKDTTFKKEGTIVWKCGNCGYLHEGEEALDECPACIHPKAHFQVYTEPY
ncbi:MAG: rubrerythrin family protein [Firmicutes bacterium]|jgi:rubrerythrin|nr:rubrerythrin family protein [Bacillota bacterium]